MSSCYIMCIFSGCALCELRNYRARRPQHPARRHTSMEASTPQVGRPRLKRPLSTSCESPPKIFSATQMLQFQLATEALLPTGLRDVDWLLGGGLATGEVTEIFGGPSVDMPIGERLSRLIVNHATATGDLRKVQQ